MTTAKPTPATFGPDLLAWYDAGHRDLPWRAAPGRKADPFHVMLSEIMLQQTVVATVMPYFHRFLARWPDVQALADAEREAIMRAWAGLGYYARARRLHEAAHHIAHDLRGVFPQNEAGWRALPGIGPYTAAAIAAIAFDQQAVVVDGNVERVVARLFAVAQPLPAAKAQLRELAASLTPASRPGDYAQAMMDFGATLCTPRGPRCPACPVAKHCAVAGARASEYPRRTLKPPRPERLGQAYFLTRPDGAVLLEARPSRGLLGGMTGFPLSGFDGTVPILPQGVTWQALPGEVRHVFTHFGLTLQVMRGVAAGPAALSPHQTWTRPQALGEAALPSLMRKILAHATNHSGELA